MPLDSTENQSSSQRRRREAIAMYWCLHRHAGPELIDIIRDTRHTLLMRCVALRCLIFYAPQAPMAHHTFSVRRRLTRRHFGV
jgi:hypothetical protein